MYSCLDWHPEPIVERWYSRLCCSIHIQYVIVCMPLQDWTTVEGDQALSAAEHEADFMYIIVAQYGHLKPAEAVSMYRVQ